MTVICNAPSKLSVNIDDCGADVDVVSCADEFTQTVAGFTAIKGFCTDTSNEVDWLLFDAQVIVLRK